MVTMIGTLVALASGLFFALEFAWLGGILAQLSSIIDGIDGDLAKLTRRMTPFGGFLDSILDRYADSAIFMGMTLYAFKHEGGQHTILIGLFAILGSILVSYTRLLANNISKTFFEGKVAHYLANRDIRLFVVMVGSLLSVITSTLVLYTLLIIVAITTITIIMRAIEIYKKINVSKGVESI